MKKSAKFLYLLTLLNIMLVGVVLSGTFTPKTWNAGETLTAADLNALTTAVQAAVGGNDAAIAALQTDVGTLQTDLAAANSTIAALSDDGATLTISGRNVQIVSGSGSTDDGGRALTGLGNLIIGYNEDGGTAKTRGGSHNVVIGTKHAYSSYGGLVAGLNNTINGSFSSVSGGYGNTAGGAATSVSGGYNNKASGYISSVGGGQGCDTGNTDTDNFEWIVGTKAGGCSDLVNP